MIQLKSYAGQNVLFQLYLIMKQLQFFSCQTISYPFAESAHYSFSKTVYETFQYRFYDAQKWNRSFTVEYVFFDKMSARFAQSV